MKTPGIANWLKYKMDNIQNGIHYSIATGRPIDNKLKQLIKFDRLAHLVKVKKILEEV